jgi:hypothetical protein
MFGHAGHLQAQISERSSGQYKVHRINFQSIRMKKHPLPALRLSGGNLRFWTELPDPAWMEEMRPDGTGVLWFSQ